MKRINIFVIVYIFTIFSSCRQENEFEKELNKFRFSLNEQLEKYEDEKIYNFKFNENDSIILLIDNFIYVNRNKIKVYRKNILEKYENNPDFKFDISKYEKVDFNYINDNIDNYNLVKNAPLSKLLWINPMSEISALKTMYFAQENGADELAVFSAKISITSSLIKTRKISNYQWEIIDNSYDIVSKFIYDLNEEKVTKIEVFKRKTDR
ncbi:hypothetical protein PG637_02580 [Riemerella anatipestifer]|nr:hypothetical protein [Riemerella anatipestifer]MDY3324558.1 hypothetical protein [Riemerella anatipestifer]MDY3353368.1 hypothetical protein [Riemerella anatipestifer]